MSKNISIYGLIEEISYESSLNKEDLPEIYIDSLEKFDIEKLGSCNLLTINNYSIAISKWVSPKRTRSYPYERIYNILGKAVKKVTIIPVVKDEGINGDRDFLQWDTISLMSLLDVYVILAYYDKADKHKVKDGKITNQRFNNEYIKSNLEDLQNYCSSALHWNLKQLNKMPFLLQKVKSSYQKISQILGVQLHGDKKIDSFLDKIDNDYNNFMQFSRDKAEKAQYRELQTIQPKENLSSQSKGKITISNYLGGRYYFTVDETYLDSISNTLYLIECKHSNSRKLVSKSDIKDGLLKMIVYTNLSRVSINNREIHYKPILLLTSNQLGYGWIDSSMSEDTINNYTRRNRMTSKDVILIKDLFIEADKNGFIVRIGNFG